ncbi:MAG: cellulase family glycosylhydrolase [Candidatus Nitrosocaldus sp.]
MAVTSTSVNNTDSLIHTIECYAIDRLNNISDLILFRFIIPADRLCPSSYKGINIHDRELTRRENGHYVFREQPSIAEILADVKYMGLNAIRVNTFWETHRYFKARGNESAYLDRIKAIADEADRQGIAVLYNAMHQWKISGSIVPEWGSGRGAGFPYSCLEALGIPAGSKYNDIINGRAVYDIFWQNFVDNYQCTIDGVTKPIWEHIWYDHLKKIVEVTADRASTLGYTLINEPFHANNVPISKIQGLGNYHSFIARKIREVTRRKKIIFTEFMTVTSSDNWGGLGQRDKALIYLIPRYENGDIIDNILFTYHVYAADTGFNDMYIRKANNIESVIKPYGIPIIVTEFNANTTYTEIKQEGLINYLQEFKNRGYGWFYFGYDPNYHSTIKDLNYNDRLNSAGIKFKDMLRDAVQYVYYQS